MILDKISNFFRQPDLFSECRNITRRNKKKNAIGFYIDLYYDVKRESGKGRSNTMGFIEHGKDYSMLALRFFKFKHRGFNVEIKDMSTFYSYKITW